MKKPTCENLDGQCAKSWCDCAYLRRRSEVARIITENLLATGNPAPTLCLPRASQGLANIGYQPRQRAGLAAPFPIIHLVLASLVLIFSGCASRPAVAKRPPVNAAPVLAGQIGKDATILTEAAKIDAIAPEVREHTDAQRAAVAAAPAQDVAKIVAEYEAVNKEASSIIAALRAEIENLKSAEQRKQVATCRWIGFGLLATALLLGYARQIQFATVAGGIGFLALGLAQLLSQPWFTTALNCAIGVAVIALAAAAWHAYRKGDLAAKTANEAAKLKDTLSVMVPALDGALKDIDAASQSVIRSTLSRFMDREHKDLIKQVRIQADKPLTS